MLPVRIGLRNKLFMRTQMFETLMHKSSVIFPVKYFIQYYSLSWGHPSISFHHLCHFVVLCCTDNNLRCMNTVLWCCHNLWPVYLASERTRWSLFVETLWWKMMRKYQKNLAKAGVDWAGLTSCYMNTMPKYMKNRLILTVKWDSFGPLWCQNHLTIYAF